MDITVKEFNRPATQEANAGLYYCIVIIEYLISYFKRYGQKV
jgi:hypothetical protein